MSYVFMAVHYPQAGQRNDVYVSMKRMAESMAGTPGLIEIGPCLEYDGDAVVGLSRWESRERWFSHGWWPVCCSTWQRRTGRPMSRRWRYWLRPERRRR